MTKNILTKEDFEKSVSELAKYQKSEEGQIAKRINDFEKKRKITPVTNAQIDSFYLAVDKEFGTNLFLQLRKPAPSGTIRVTSYDTIKKEAK